MSAAVAGAAVGSAVGGSWSDKRGRKSALKLADAFFAFGAAVMALAPDATILILGEGIMPPATLWYPICIACMHRKVACRSKHGNTDDLPGCWCTIQ